MLTSSQHEALDITRHLSVTANAGSGKTMVLVERYLAILLARKASVSEVVAITFTDKAASELRRKISESVAKRIAEAPDDSHRTTLQELRDQLSGAVIGTIHWFCAKLLRDYPVEAGVDAAFVVPELVDQRAMLDAAVKETFEWILTKESSDPMRKRLFDVLRALGRSKLISIVHALMKRREQVQRWLNDGLYARTDEEVLALWQATLADVVHKATNDAQVLGDMNQLIAAARGRTAMKVREKFTTFLQTAAAADRVKQFDELLDLMVVDKGSARIGFFGNGSQDGVADAAKRLREKQKAIAELVEFVGTGEDDGHRALLRHTRVLLEVYQIASEKYEEKKIENAYLDFDDLQLRTEHLLRNTTVLERLARRFKFIMVDEYQDTNRLQYEILLPLVYELSRGNLFIVGDPKQSIYGFRDADVAVFNQTKAEIKGNSGGGVVLNESFRLLRDVAAFVNRIFEPLMTSEQGEFDVGYDRLIRGRQNTASGRVEMILREAGEGEDSEPTASEPELIARRIVQLLAEPYQIFSKDEQPRALRFSDIAILIRSRTGLGALEEALIHHNIPYLISGGIKYFQTQGIYDFYNYFRFLLNTDDDVALVGILRSPFFTVSDAELFELAFERKGVLWKTLATAKGKGTSASLARAFELLSAHLELASRLPVPELVNRIMDDTAYAGFVEGSARPEQLFANLEKLKRIALRYEQQGFTNLYDFTGRLKSLIEEEEDEGQAAVDVSADAVKVMTIHVAKGLEFPVVILPSLERTFLRDDDPFLDNALGLGFSASNEEKIPIVEFLRNRSWQRSRAEEKRVLYVACTRARDLLILSGMMPKNRATHSFMNWILDGLNVEGTIDEKVLAFDAMTEALEVSDGEFTRTMEKHTLKVFILREDDLPASVFRPPTVSEATARRRVLIEPIPPRVEGEMFSASKIRTYVECPAKYYLRYVAGLPVLNVRSPKDSLEDEGDVAIPAELRGRAFHAIMQNIDRMVHDEKTIIRALKTFIQQDALSILAEPSIELDNIAQSVLNVVRSEFWREVQQGGDARTEFTLLAPIGKNFLTGTIDRVYNDKQNRWHILDYKTDAVSSASLEHTVALYEPQLKFYALLVQKFFSATGVDAHLLFTSRVEAPVHFHYDARTLTAFEQELNEVISKIERGDFKRRGLPCSDCPFAPEGCRC